MSFSIDSELSLSVLEILPNPVLVKDASLRYVWVNSAFETLFGLSRNDIIGQLDVDIFKDRQAVQCNGGDRRVLESGEVGQAFETVFDPSGKACETITRKSRLILSNDVRYLVGVMHDVTEVQRANEQLEAQSIELKRLASTDALTGCLNRRALMEALPGCVAASKENWSLLALDIDHFKSVNDTYGHDAGDAVLVHFCDFVRSALDSRAVFSRLGGEEFVVLLPDTNSDEAYALSQKICDDLASFPCEFAKNSIHLTVSIGSVSQPAKADYEINALLKRADEALYAAKAQGRNRVIKAAA